MLEGGFNLRKWNLNSSAVVEKVSNAKEKLEVKAATEPQPVMEKDQSYAKASIGCESKRNQN